MRLGDSASVSLPPPRSFPLARLALRMTGREARRSDKVELSFDAGEGELAGRGETFAELRGAFILGG